MSKWTHILSLLLSSEISSAVENRKFRKQKEELDRLHDLDEAIQADQDMDLLLEEEAAFAQAEAFDEEREEYQEQIAQLYDELETERNDHIETLERNIELLNEIEGLHHRVADLQTEVDELRDELDNN